VPQNRSLALPWTIKRNNAVGVWKVQSVDTSGSIRGLGERSRNQTLACCPCVRKESCSFWIYNLFSSGLSGRLLGFDFCARLN
jgi:hypothetical protein